MLRAGRRLSALDNTPRRGHHRRSHVHCRIHHAQNQRATKPHPRFFASGTPQRRGGAHRSARTLSSQRPACRAMTMRASQCSLVVRLVGALKLPTQIAVAVVLVSGVSGAVTPRPRDGREPNGETCFPDRRPHERMCPCQQTDGGTLCSDSCFWLYFDRGTVSYHAREENTGALRHMSRVFPSLGYDLTAFVLHDESADPLRLAEQRLHVSEKYLLGLGVGKHQVLRRRTLQMTKSLKAEHFPHDLNSAVKICVQGDSTVSEIQFR